MAIHSTLAQEYLTIDLVKLHILLEKKGKNKEFERKCQNRPFGTPKRSHQILKISEKGYVFGNQYRKLVQI